MRGRTERAGYHGEICKHLYRHDNIPPYDQSPAERFAGMTREEIDAMIEEEEALIARSGGKWPAVKNA